MWRKISSLKETLYSVATLKSPIINQFTGRTTMSYQQSTYSLRRATAKVKHQLAHRMKFRNQADRIQSTCSTKQCFKFKTPQLISSFIKSRNNSQNKISFRMNIWRQTANKHLPINYLRNSKTRRRHGHKCPYRICLEKFKVMHLNWLKRRSKVISNLTFHCLIFLSFQRSFQTNHKIRRTKNMIRRLKRKVEQKKLWQTRSD